MRPNKRLESLSVCKHHCLLCFGLSLHALQDRMWVGYRKTKRNNEYINAHFSLSATQATACNVFLDTIFETRDLSMAEEKAAECLCLEVIIPSVSAGEVFLLLPRVFGDQQVELLTRTQT
ncbi:hypothetical protein AMECASPLE_026793 [Ameca splendens]|uniref:Uncharacterized protein n=1 Tax=Ameca splendens TaxID=208324 RepID=A0ABV0ZEY9_9TELE